MCVCMYMYMCMCMSVFMYAYTCMYTHVWVYICTQNLSRDDMYYHKNCVYNIFWKTCIYL